MPSEPSRNYFLAILDAYSKWEGRIKALGSLFSLLLLLVGSAGAAMATAIHATASYLSSFLTTLPLALSVGMATALVTRYKLTNPLDFAWATLLTFIGNSFLTKWLGLGLQIDYNQVFASVGIVIPNATGSVQVYNPGLIFLLPLAILWAYFQLYGVLGFSISLATGLIAGRIIGRRR